MRERRQRRVERAQLGGRGSRTHGPAMIAMLAVDGHLDELRQAR